MAYSIESKPEAITDLERLTQAVRDRIVKKIYWLGENFDQINPESLTGNWAGYFKLRVGDYRVIYEFSIDLKIITIYRIGHRREIYD